VAEIKILPDAEAVAQDAAVRWVESARAAVEARGAFRVALSGGSTPRRLYELMASESLREQAPWAQTYIFWGDERRVPASHPDSNYHLARVTLIDHVPVPLEHVFRMDGEGLARSAAREYEEALRLHFDLRRGQWPRFDLVLLGLGTDGHTASIFPGTRAVSDLSNMAIVYEVPQLGMERMTLTLPVLNNAQHILFMVTGAEKAAVVKAVLAGEHRPSTYPAQAVKPVDGTLTWLLDEEAAAQLPR
jgi:6-phosphogluconolactonase